MTLLPQLALAAAALLAGCAIEAPAMVVAQSLGSRQCEGDGRSAAALAQALRAAGVEVRAEGCGHDGRLRPAVCGAPDGRLAVLDIAPGGAERAAALGWRPLAAWPEARRQPC